MKFKFQIDEKSLFYGLKNDYKRGQTATVSTPINQSKYPKKWRNDIIKLYTSGLSMDEVPQDLVDRCLNKTTSQANSKIVHFFAFNNIFLDGIKLETNFSFGMYVKEETDEFITNKKEEIVPNTHLGRQKLHYPISLHYNSKSYSIDNRSILDSILAQNGGFAFIVRGFEIDTETKSINFITSLIGLKGLLLSNVFKIKKGVGKKLLVKEVNLEAQDLIIDDSVLIATDFTPTTNDIDFESANLNKAKNGALGEKYVYDNVLKLISEYAEDVLHISKQYPTSPYDIEYIENGVKKYVEVKSTSGSKEIFYMSSGEIKFMEKYRDRYTLILVTNVTTAFPKTKLFTYEEIQKLDKEYPTIRFYS